MYKDYIKKSQTSFSCGGIISGKVFGLFFQGFLVLIVFFFSFHFQAKNPHFHTQGATKASETGTEGQK